VRNAFTFKMNHSAGPQKTMAPGCFEMSLLIISRQGVDTPRDESAKF